MPVFTACRAAGKSKERKNAGHGGFLSYSFFRAL